MSGNRRVGIRVRRAVLLVAMLAVRELAASDPGTALEAAALAKGSLPGLIRAGQGVVEVPRQVGQCLRLPLGVVELLFSPLPGVTVSEGLKDTGKGVVAPFKLVIAVLEMPFEVLGGLGDAATGLVE